MGKTLRMIAVGAVASAGLALTAGTASAEPPQYGPEWSADAAQPGPEWNPGYLGPEWNPGYLGPEWDPDNAQPGSADILEGLLGGLF